MVEGGL
jgi:hypothetical protein